MVSDPVRVGSQKLWLTSLRRVYTLVESYARETERLCPQKDLVKLQPRLRCTNVSPKVGAPSYYILQVEAVKNVTVYSPRRPRILTEFSKPVRLVGDSDPEYRLAVRC